MFERRKLRYLNAMTTVSLPVGHEAQSRALHVLTSARIVIPSLVVISFVVRFLASLERATPRYLPDEYLYGQFARSLAQGEGIAILGQPTVFYSILQPLLTAPFWLVDDVLASYRLTQAFNAAAMALAVVPVVMLARRLSLSRAATLWCALATAAAPGGLYSGYVTADALAFLVALFAIDAGVRALVTPTLGSQAGFVGLAGLAAFARFQYVVLVPVAMAAALTLERGRPMRAARRYPFLAGLLALGLVGGLVAGRSVLGRYETVAGFGVSAGTLGWAGSTGLLLLLSVGAATAPGGGAWLLHRVRVGRSDARTAFASLALTLLVALVGVSAVISTDTGSERFFERYLLLGVPLIALAFALWITEGRPDRVIALGLAVLLIVVVARLPLSGYATGQGLAGSPTLLAIGRLTQSVGIGNASLLAALVATLAALVSILATARSNVAWLAASLSLALLVTASVGAQLADAAASRGLVGKAFADHPNWVDRAGVEHVLLVQTPWSGGLNAMLAAGWNRSVTGAMSLGGLIETFDGLGDPLELRSNGTLVAAGRTVTRPVLFATSGTAVAFGAGARVTEDRLFTLAVPRGAIRLTAFAAGVRADGSFAPFGRIHAFPEAAGTCRVTIVDVRLPVGFPSVTLRTTDIDGTRRRILLTPAHRRGALSISSAPGHGRWLDYRAVDAHGRPLPTTAGAIGAAKMRTRAGDCGGYHG